MPPNVQHSNRSLISLTNRLGRLLASELRRRTALENMGLMPHHMGILADLWRKDGIRQQDLVVSLIKDKATIARAIASMEQANVVVRIQDERDKRYKRIYLTHKGKSLKEELIPQMESLEKEVASNIDEEAYQNCLDVLEKIHDLLLK